MIDRHFHWRFGAFNNKDVVAPDRVNQLVSIEVIGFLDEETAKMAAGDIVKRDNYYLQYVWECNRCGFERATADSLTKMTQ